MAAVEIFPEELDFEMVLRPPLRVVRHETEFTQSRRGPLVANRRAARARMKQRRRRTAVVAFMLTTLVLLAWPGHAFGGTNGVGLSTDVASTSTLASGMVYVVQPGDTLETIADDANPVNPALARAALVAELHSSVVIAGEHVLIP
jgi:predicted anti-sigma-YlaC factor YlaD